jgi:hypothetical protein
MSRDPASVKRSRQRYRQSAQGQATEQRYNQSATGQAKQQRSSQTRKAKRAAKRAASTSSTPTSPSGARSRACGSTRTGPSGRWRRRRSKGTAAARRSVAGGSGDARDAAVRAAFPAVQQAARRSHSLATSSYSCHACSRSGQGGGRAGKVAVARAGVRAEHLCSGVVSLRASQIDTGGTGADLIGHTFQKNQQVRKCFIVFVQWLALRAGARGQSEFCSTANVRARARLPHLSPLRLDAPGQDAAIRASAAAPRALPPAPASSVLPRLARMSSPFSCSGPSAASSRTKCRWRKRRTRTR